MGSSAAIVDYTAVDVIDHFTSREVRTVVDDVIPFNQMPDAMTRFAAGHLAGKVLIAD